MNAGEESTRSAGTSILVILSAAMFIYVIDVHLRDRHDDHERVDLRRRGRPRHRGHDGPGGHHRLHPHDGQELVAGLPPKEGEEIRSIARNSQLSGYQAALLVGAGVALLGFLLALRLPKRKLEGALLEESARAGSKTIPTFDLEVRDLATEGTGHGTIEGEAT